MLPHPTTMTVNILMSKDRCRSASGHRSNWPTRVGPILGPVASYAGCFIKASVSPLAVMDDSEFASFFSFLTSTTLFDHLIYVVGMLSWTCIVLSLISFFNILTSLSF